MGRLVCGCSRPAFGGESKEHVVEIVVHFAVVAPLLGASQSECQGNGTLESGVVAPVSGASQRAVGLQ